MLNKLFSLFGFDLRHQIHRAKAEVREVTRDVTDHIKSEARSFALQVALGTIGIMLGLMSFAVFLVGIYRWIEIQYNSNAALIAVGGGTALLALILMFIATRKKNNKDSEPRRKDSEPRNLEEDLITPPPFAAEDTIASSPHIVSSPHLAEPAHTFDLQGSLSTLLADLVTRTPRSGTPLDSILTQVTGRAAAASSETITLAADLVRKGPRKAMFGVLGASLLVGWFLSKTTLPFNKPSSLPK